jgi:dipeptidyl-peptidase 4
MLNRSSLVAAAVVAGVALGALPALAQKVYTTQDYAQAERWMSYNVNGMVHHTIRGVSYLPSGRVFYRDPGEGGTAYMIADPAKGSVAPAFDNAKLAAALNKAAGDTKSSAGKLGVTEYKEGANGGFSVTTGEGVFDCDAAVTACTEEPKPPSEEKIAEKTGAKKVIARRHAGDENLSPDKKTAAFIRDNNLWVRTVATGEERQLTTDGI